MSAAVLPPVVAAPELEAAVVSAVLLDPSALLEVLDVLDPADLYDSRCSLVLRAAADLARSGRAVDHVAVARHLAASGQLEPAGGTPWLAELTDATPAVGHVLDHARHVAALARARALQHEARRIVAEAPGQPDPLAWMQSVESRVYAACRVEAQRRYVWTAREALAEWQREQREDSRAGWVATGFSELDRRLGGGLRVGSQYVMGGRPGHGKTALALAIALTVAERGDPVVLISCEMPLRQIMSRAVAQLTRLDTGRVERNELTSAEEWSLAVEARHRIESMPLVLDDRPGATLRQIRSTIRRATSMLGAAPRLVVVDYVQILDGERSRGENRENEIRNLSTGLMWLAKEFGCATLVLSQLTRANARENREPTLTDLRDSGALEQDAFGVLLLHRPDTEETRRDSAATLLVAKLRQGGAIGSVPLHFHGPSTSFTSAVGLDRGEDY